MKFCYFKIIIFLTFVSCNINNLQEIHGISNLRLKINEIKINITNKNDIINLIGGPIIVDVYDKNIWSYYETRKKVNFFGNKKLYVNDILILKFNSLGILVNYDTYDINSLKDLQFDKELTESKFMDESMISTFLFASKKRWQMAKEKNRN